LDFNEHVPIEFLMIYSGKKMRLATLKTVAFPHVDYSENILHRFSLLHKQA